LLQRFRVTVAEVLGLEPPGASARFSALLTDREGEMADGQVVILGGGSTGEACVSALRELEPDTKITLVERELVGGECSYYACMPTKGMLRPLEAVAGARNVPGAREAVTGPVSAEGVFAHRDAITSGWDDSSQADWLASKQADLVRGEGRVLRPGVIAVGEREVEYGRLVIASGSRPSIPPIPGLDGVGYWTNREATSKHEIPSSMVVLGAGPVGCELAQFFSRMGARVSIVDVADRLLPRDHPDAGDLLGEFLEGEGITLHLGQGVERVDPGVKLRLDDGTVVEGERLLVATGRRPNSDGCGFEQLGVTLGKGGAVVVDERMRAAEGVWAIGDVNAIAMFTHAGKYQARVAATDMAGKPAKADHSAVPAVTFTDPQVASVGRTSGAGLVTGERRIDSVARTSTYERPKRPGFLKVIADPERGVLVGAVAVGPEAGEWLGQLTLAVRAQVPVELLRETIQPYPTFSEAVQFAVRDLPM
jgi:pyruvate/2-oxoglutarate dehydrogenase complex dihydrolipoamide dehydrogenase (E3) component